MSLALALRNKQMLALIIVALLTLAVITVIVLSAVFQLNIWGIFTPGKAATVWYN